MSLRINLNSAALNASRNLAVNDSKMGQSIARLSSGYRINNAADDPAGLVNSENLRAQIGGLGQAISNSQDAVNMVKTAEGALTEVHSLLQSMRNLAVHAANAGVNSDEAVAADQAQITSAIQSLNNISKTTAFGNKKLLDGTSSIGFGTITATGGSADDITNVAAASTGSVFANATGDSKVKITITQAASKAEQAGTEALPSGAGNTLGDATGWTANTTSTLKVNGIEVGTFSATQTSDDVIRAINSNAVLNQSVVASRDTNDHIVITSKNYGSSAGVTVEETLSDTSLAGATNIGYLVAGGTAALDDTTTSASVTTAKWGTDLQGTVEGNGVGGATTVEDFKSGSGFVMKNAAGDAITFTSAMTGDAGDTYDTTVSGTGTIFQIGANAGETASISLSSTATKNLGTDSATSVASVADIDVTKDAQSAIKVLDAAIAQVSKQRADLGAFQKNVLESNINSLSVAKENVSASESSIRDTDMAAEMVQFTRYQILNQAGTAMLTQANQAPQQLLSLLR